MATYQKPDFFTKQIFNRLAVLGMKLGLSVQGSRILSVRGRKTGATYATPVNPLPIDGARYLVSTRGNSGWVRNIRASGEAELRVGRKREQIRVREVPDDEKPALLRAYLEKWAWEAGRFFGGVTAKAPDEELRRIAPDHPIFRIVETA